MSDNARSDKDRDEERLDGWKRIGAFLGRDERTAKRWESSRGLPVHRLPGDRSPVYALPSELRAWLERQDGGSTAAPAAQPPLAPVRPGRARLWLAGGLIIAVLSLGLWFGLRPRPSAEAKSADPQAQALFARGELALELRTPTSLREALTDFDQAIDHDRTFAAAYAGLADAWLLIREYADVPDAEAYPKAEAAAQVAIKLQPDNANAHAALAFARYWWRGDLVGARTEFDRALDLQPGNARVHHWYANVLAQVGLLEAAKRQIARAQDLDPGSLSIEVDRVHILQIEDPERAAPELRRLARLRPDNRSAHAYLADYALVAGRDQEYLQEAETTARITGDAAAAARAAAAAKAYAKGGREAMLATLLLDAQRRGDDADQAGLLALLGRRDEAIARIAAALAARPVWAYALAHEPAFHSLYGSPQFRAMIRAPR
jgi:Tfp pilus assembly protein PilF